MEHKPYIESLCQLTSDPMGEIYREELAYLNGERDYEDIESRKIISLNSLTVIDIDQIFEVLKPLETKFKVKSEIVEYESNYIEFTSPLIKAWIELHLKTNPKERGR